MDIELLNSLVCPRHNDSSLILDRKELLCSLGCRYTIVEIEGQLVPNLLVLESGQKWSPGERSLNSHLLASVAGSAFPVHSFEGATLDLGCGDNARGTVNVDCYVPRKIPPNFVLANNEFLPFREKSFDYVTSYYNLEHLVSPVDFLRSAYKIARRRVDVLTDNSDWAGDFLFRIVGKGRIFHDEHYYKWSVEYLANLVKRAGCDDFEVYVENKSNGILVSLFAGLAFIRKLRPIVMRDLHLVINVS